MYFFSGTRRKHHRQKLNHHPQKQNPEQDNQQLACISYVLLLSEARRTW